MNDICVVMRTFNRMESEVTLHEHFVRRNYLFDTLRSFSRAGVFQSPRLDSFHVIDSGSRDTVFFQGLESYPAIVHRGERRTPNQNAGYALKVGADSGAPWVLFCEDDIDVCADFLGSVGRWLDKYAREDRRLYTFGSNQSAATGGIKDVHISGFYGTTCYALRHDDARSMSQFITENPLYRGGRFYGTGPDGTGVPVAHDLHYHEWAERTYPEIMFFAASCPSFVQHIGAASGISGRAHLITYDSWPGPDWKYDG